MFYGLTPLRLRGYLDAFLHSGIVPTLHAAIEIVTTSGNTFVPQHVQVNAGDTVRWTGLQGGFGHNVVEVTQACYNDVTPPLCTTPKSGGFNSGNQGQVAQFEFTFNTPGVYYYICTPHRDSSPPMIGTVTVLNAPSPTPSPTTTASPTPSPTPTPTPPVNDNCANAICLQDQVPYFGTTIGATGTDITSCGTNDTADVWFTYTPLTSGVYTVDTCGTNFFDHVLAAYDACNGTQITCQDNDICNGAQDLIAVNMTAGTTYYIRLAGVNGSTGNYQIQVAGGEGACGNQAAITGHTIPAQLGANHTYAASVVVRNTGNTTWTPGAGYLLAITTDSCSMGPVFQQVELPPGTVVPPGSSHTFDLSLNAPAGLQVCNLTFQMAQTGGPGLFGQSLSLNPEIVAPVNNSQLQNHSVPAQMFTNQKAWVNLNIRNLGNTQWPPAPGAYTLKTNSDACSLVAAANYWPFEFVSPNTNGNIFVYLEAPAAPANCSFQMQMSEGGTNFGPTFDFNVSIVSKPNASGDWSVYE